LVGLAQHVDFAASVLSNAESWNAYLSMALGVRRSA
jgi:hypothetical protein